MSSTRHIQQWNYLHQYLKNERGRGNFVMENIRVTEIKKGKLLVINHTLYSLYTEGTMHFILAEIKYVWRHSFERDGYKGTQLFVDYFFPTIFFLMENPFSRCTIVFPTIFVKDSCSWNIRLLLCGSFSYWWGRLPT